jgi:N-acetyl sugar amidotransferase
VKKNLVILVADYPNPHGEPFLENELKILAKDFENIYLIPKLYLFDSDNIGFENQKQLYLPKNAILTPLVLTKPSVFSKLKFLFSFNFYFEILLAKFKHKSNLSISLIKLILYYLNSTSIIEKALVEIIKLNNINSSNTIFYSYWCDEGALALANLKKKKNISDFVTRLHGWDVYFERHEQRFLPFREVIFNYASLILPISNDARKYLLDKKMSVHPEKIITSRLGVAGINEINRNLKDNNEVHIITISHINRVKRLDRLIDALSKVTNFNVVWHHIGWGHEANEKEFRIQINEALLQNKNVKVLIHGEFTNKQVAHFLENTRIDVLVNCSENEGIPVSIMEAFSAGIPSVAFNIGGIPEIITHGRSGLLLKDEEGNHSMQLFEAIKSFLTMPQEEYDLYSKNAKFVWKLNYNKETNYRQLSNLLYNDTLPTLKVLSCNQCLVDSELYPSIVIDKFGVCNVCRIVEKKNDNLALLASSNHIDVMLDSIKASKSGKYDCIIGISGGVDSAYLALKAREWGLNPLLVHIDNGWNSELAVFNIQTLIKELNYDLYTVVINWKELRDVVRSFFKASVIDIDWANEMCAQAALYQVCNKFGLKYILTGHQIATEGWMPDNIVHYKLDLINFKAIHRKFGEKKLKTYPTIGFLKTYYYERIKKIQYVSPLDYIPYNKEEVKKELIEKFGWRDYGQKHFESIFTRFYQAYVLPKKFKVDKRRFHYSASILSGQMTKEDAISILSSNEYIDSGQVKVDMEFIIKKLGFSREQFQTILNTPPKSHFDYPSLLNFRKKLKKAKDVLRNTW